MVNERTARRSSFVDGTPIRFADGQVWMLPGRYLDQSDPEYDALLRGVFESEDNAERLRAELALAIMLLGRNYHLKQRDYQQILGFQTGGPEQAEAQRALRAMALDHAERYEALISSQPTSDERAQNEWNLSRPRRGLRFLSIWTH